MILPDELVALRRFHGHLGPYVVLGYMMGRIGRERFQNRISAVVFSGTRRPLSCLVDGIQFSSCCTLGKGNISVREGGKVKAEFAGEDGSLTLELLPGIKERIDSDVTKENEEAIAMDLYSLPASSLFSITEGGPSPSGKAPKS